MGMRLASGRSFALRERDSPSPRAGPSRSDGTMSITPGATTNAGSGWSLVGLLEGIAKFAGMACSSGVESPRLPSCRRIDENTHSLDVFPQGLVVDVFPRLNFKTVGQGKLVEVGGDGFGPERFNFTSHHAVTPERSAAGAQKSNKLELGVVPGS